MGKLRYRVEQEKVGKWLIEEIVDIVLDTEEATRVTITDELSGDSVSADGADYDDALERACSKMGISVTDLDEEI